MALPAKPTFRPVFIGYLVPSGDTVVFPMGNFVSHGEAWAAGQEAAQLAAANPSGWIHLTGLNIRLECFCAYWIEVRDQDGYEVGDGARV